MGKLQSLFGSFFFFFLLFDIFVFTQDRTSQLSCISMMLLNPFFRTIRGLCELIEKAKRKREGRKTLLFQFCNVGRKRNGSRLAISLLVVTVTRPGKWTKKAIRSALQCFFSFLTVFGALCFFVVSSCSKKQITGNFAIFIQFLSSSLAFSFQPLWKRFTIVDLARFWETVKENATTLRSFLLQNIC
jgi:hypothetical protein